MLSLLSIALLAAPPVTNSPINGVALALYYEAPEEGMTFDRMVDEIAGLGATHISILVQWSQPDTSASAIQPHPKETPADATVSRVIQRAQAKGLKVMLFPILWIEKRAIGDWRGTLKPSDPVAWWDSYRRFIAHYAKLAARERVDIFSVGSELGSMEGHTLRWRELIADVRKKFSGKLIYSANWDHYQHVTFWEAVDYIGMTAYYRLTTSLEPTLQGLVSAWQKVRLQLLDWYEGQKKPLVFTELGYPSVDGAAASPWDYTSGRAIDHEEQRLCFEAFFRVWRDEPRLAGVFFWNWWGPSDGQNTWYTLKGKPALAVVRKWMSRTQAKQ